MLRYVLSSMPDGDATAAVQDFFGPAAMRNERCAVSGVLYATDGAFLELIEGPEKHVLALRKSIESDPRHLVLASGTQRVRGRSFSRQLALGLLTGEDETAETGHLADLHPHPTSEPEHLADIADFLLSIGARKYPSMALPPARDAPTMQQKLMDLEKTQRSAS